MNNKNEEYEINNDKSKSCKRDINYDTPIPDNDVKMIPQSNIKENIINNNLIPNFDIIYDEKKNILQKKTTKMLMMLIQIIITIIINLTIRLKIIQ